MNSKLPYPNKACTIRNTGYRRSPPPSRKQKKNRGKRGQKFVDHSRFAGDRTLEAFAKQHIAFAN